MTLLYLLRTLENMGSVQVRVEWSLSTMGVGAIMEPKFNVQTH